MGIFGSSGAMDRDMAASAGSNDSIEVEATGPRHREGRATPRTEGSGLFNRGTASADTRIVEGGKLVSTSDLTENGGFW